MRAVCSAVSKPVNFAVGGRGRSFSVAELVEAGVKRISFAASFHRAAMTGLANAAKEARDKGTFNYVEQSPTTAELNQSTFRSSPSRGRHAESEQCACLSR